MCPVYFSLFLVGNVSLDMFVACFTEELSLNYFNV